MWFPKRILIIDDDPDDCFFFGKAIYGLGLDIEVYFEMNSLMAIISLEHKRIPVPDLLVLDWNMPKLNGSNCLKAIRQLPYYSSVPIVVITTSAALQDRQEAIRLGACLYLSKPSSVSELQDMLQNIFSIVHDRKE